MPCIKPKTRYFHPLLLYVYNHKDTCLLFYLVSVPGPKLPFSRPSCSHVVLQVDSGIFSCRPGSDLMRLESVFPKTWLLTWVLADKYICIMRHGRGNHTTAVQGSILGVVRILAVLYYRSSLALTLGSHSVPVLHSGHSAWPLYIYRVSHIAIQFSTESARTTNGPTGGDLSHIGVVGLPLNYLLPERSKPT